MSELYTRDILRWTTRLGHQTPLANPDVTARRTSRICGSRMRAAARLDGDRITDFSQEVTACALGQAAAAIMESQVIGLDRATFEDVDRRFRHMMETGEADFPEAFRDLALLAPVVHHPGRKGSVRLPFQVIGDLFRAAGGDNGAAAQTDI
ncbi:iron-sulfur cluster assembly scaffold protein [Yunchengibacter salinarum]|uniref:iron-sulfur cluster assembly scaffold protein n=1 Tax=Yunchengibacter salinarum TaxID=3133399 RepID=UPI0035B5D912